MTSVPALLDAASLPIPDSDRETIMRGAYHVLLLALVDALEHPDDSRPVAQGARGLVHEASVDRVAALVEPLAPGDAHAVVQALARHGYIAPELAQIAHARIDVSWQRIAGRVDLSAQSTKSAPATL